MKTSRPVHLHPSWVELLKDEFDEPYMKELREFLITQKRKGKVIFPPGPEIFNALNLTPFGMVKVVILGQDPYHGPGQAHGLCFSVRPTVAVPPSLINIYKELQDDLGIPPARHGFLESWTLQGVLLLNAVLTVERYKPASHRGRGWENFTDRIIRELDAGRDDLVFILWGSYAQRKGSFIDREKHLVITAPHPSPLSASRGFFGTRPFSRTNAWLREKGKTPIDWRLPKKPVIHSSGNLPSKG